MSEQKSFREVLQELYMICCERKGWNPERSVSVFEVEAQVSEGSVSKVLRGERHVIALESIDTLLAGLYNDEEGIITFDEKEKWHERLHISRAIEMAKVHFRTQINRNIESFPDEIMKVLEEELKKHFPQMRNYWAIDAIALTLLIRYWLKVKDNAIDQELVFEDRFTDKGNVILEGGNVYNRWSGHWFMPKSKETGRLWLRHGIEIPPFGIGYYPNLPNTLVHNFLASARFIGWESFGGIIVSDYHTNGIYLFGILPSRHVYGCWRYTFNKTKHHHVYKDQIFFEGSHSLRKGQPIYLKVKRDHQLVYFFINDIQIHAIEANNYLPQSLVNVGIYYHIKRTSPHFQQYFNQQPFSYLSISTLNDFCYDHFQLIKLK